jgi:4-hydroxy-3-methylbut-2-enyl diphosphate reductase
VHQEAVRHERAGHFVLVIGKAQHAEVVGITGHLSPENYQTIASTEDAERVAVPAHRSVAYVTQTTLSVDDTRQIVRALRRRFPQLQEPRKDTICYATSNRQWAVRTIAPQVEGLLVLGSATSSNSIRLTEVAQQAGCAHVRLVPDPSQFRASSLDHIRKLGITAGASAPEELVRALIQRITAHRACSIREITTAEERVQFRLPTEFSEAPASFA